MITLHGKGEIDLNSRICEIAQAYAIAQTAPGHLIDIAPSLLVPWQYTVVGDVDSSLKEDDVPLEHLVDTVLWMREALIKLYGEHGEKLADIIVHITREEK